MWLQPEFIGSNPIKKNRFIDYFEAALCYTNENRLEPDGLGKLCLTKRDDKDKMNVLPTTVKEKYKKRKT